MSLPEKRPVTLEDLLRLKRAERPPEEFWAKFEADMRAKQLSAIVNRPRWSGLSAWLGTLGRYQMPIGAAAAVALTYIGYTQYQATQATVPVPAARSVALVAAPSHSYVSVEKPAPVAAISPASSPAAPAAAPVVAESSSHLVQLPAAIAATAPAARSPFADGIAVTLADYREAPTTLRPSTFGSDSEFEVVSTRSTAVAEPLSRLDPSQERRSRLLDSALPTPRALATDWMRTRASSDDRMAESLDRASDHLLTGIRF